MSSILDSPDVLAALQQRKKATGRKLKASRQRMQVTANQFYSPVPKATTRARSISRLVSDGFFIYKSLRLFASVVTTMGSLFGSRKRRR